MFGGCQEFLDDDSEDTKVYAKDDWDENGHENMSYQPFVHVVNHFGRPYVSAFPAHATSAPGMGSPMPRLHRD